MLSKQCVDCPDRRKCAKRFINATNGDFIYCSDGSKILIENGFDE